MIRSTNRRTFGAEKWSGLASSTTSSAFFHCTNLNGPEPIGTCSWYVSAFSGFVARSASTGSQMCLGMRLTLERLLVRNGEYGALRTNRITAPDLFSILLTTLTNGLYIGTLSPIGAVNEKMTSSAVTGCPSCHFIPRRRVTSSVTLFTHFAFSAAHGLGRPSGPTRNSRSQISSVIQESVAPLMYSGLIARTGSAVFRKMCCWLPSCVAATY